MMSPDEENQTEPREGIQEEIQEETELVRAAMGGDLQAFEEIVLRHQGALRAYLAVRLARSGEAEDLAQEVFVTAFQNLAKFEISRPLGPWLRGIAHNHLRNHLRKFRTLPIGGHEELQAMLDTQIEERMADEREPATIGALRECLDQLDGPAREIVIARYLNGESVRELQAKTGRGYSALTMQLHRIRGVLADCIEGKVGFSLQRSDA